MTLRKTAIQWAGSQRWRAMVWIWIHKQSLCEWSSQDKLRILITFCELASTHEFVNSGTATCLTTISVITLIKPILTCLFLVKRLKLWWMAMTRRRRSTRDSIGVKAMTASTYISLLCLTLFTQWTKVAMTWHDTISCITACASNAWMETTSCSNSSTSWTSVA